MDFRQTYGLSEFCVLRAKSKSRNSLFVKVGGEGIEIRIVNNVLLLKSKYRMMGYLNADNPFDKKGWYCTKDLVEEKISEIIEREFADPLPKNTYVLTKLLEIGRLKIKVAVRKSGIYHEKIGWGHL